MTNRFLEHTGAKYPIIQAPMGWIARRSWPRPYAPPVASELSKLIRRNRRLQGRN